MASKLRTLISLSVLGSASSSCCRLVVAPMVVCQERVRGERGSRKRPSQPKAGMRALEGSRGVLICTFRGTPLRTREKKSPTATFSSLPTTCSTHTCSEKRTRRHTIAAAAAAAATESRAKVLHHGRKRRPITQRKACDMEGTEDRNRTGCSRSKRRSRRKGQEQSCRQQQYWIGNGRVDRETEQLCRKCRAGEEEGQFIREGRARSRCSA